MLLLNFAHPLTREHMEYVETLTGRKVEEVIALSVQFDNDKPFEPQLRVLMDKITLTSDDWQTKPILVNLPSLNTISALLLVALHGLMGHFPAILRLRPIANSIPTQYELAEIVNLQTVRDGARTMR
jgi:hypothetical protein